MKMTKNKEYIIGIDHGYGLVKTVNTTFVSGVSPIAYGQASEYFPRLLQYEGKSYAIGEDRGECLHDKTSNSNAFLLTLAAIAEELGRADVAKVGDKVTCNVILSVGVPVSDWAEHEKFAKYLTPAGRLSYRYNNVSYDIGVKDVVCWPQGYAIVSIRRSKFPDDFVCVDVGTWTIDIVPYSGDYPKMSHAESIDFGALNCIHNAQTEIRRVVGRSLNENTVQKIIEGKSSAPSPVIAKAITTACEKYVDDLLAQLADMGYSPLLSTYVFCGGGANLIKQYWIPSHHENEIAPVFILDARANAQGYEVLAAAKLD